MNLWSQSFIPTLKESPADAEIASHKLLVRAGLARKIGGGIYAYLPLGWRVMRKLEEICRQEMTAGGGIELHMPALHPVEAWEKGPRWNVAREVMFAVAGAGEGAERSREPQMVLGPTHEEIITALVAADISSYRDLPRNFFQIQTKFRNEIRPRYGLMRCREFVMKDGYSFDVDDAGAIESYKRMFAAYQRFFTRLGLTWVAVEADTGVMGGSYSHEFMIPAEVGDDTIVYCPESGYAANQEKATSKLVPEDFSDAAPSGAVEEFATPGIVTIAALAAAPYNVAAEKQFKTLVFIGDGRPFAVLLRGCDELEEAKLGSLGFSKWRQAEPEEIEKVMGAKPGSLGAVRGTIRDPKALAGIFADNAIRLVGNGTTGANKDGFHLRNVNVVRDLEITRFGDFRRVRAGEPCPRSGKPLQIQRGIEVGHVFKLGTKYSEAIGAYFVDAQKQRQPMFMGCYGIGVSRTLQAIIEQCHDADGIVWPWAVAPYQVVVTALDPSLPASQEVVASIVAAAEAAGADVLVDDREERPGVKFKDADLVGFPIRVTVSSRGLKEGIIELKLRTSKEAAKVTVAEAPARLSALIAGLSAPSAA